MSTTPNTGGVSLRVQVGHAAQAMVMIARNGTPRGFQIQDDARDSGLFPAAFVGPGRQQHMAGLMPNDVSIFDLRSANYIISLICKRFTQWRALPSTATLVRKQWFV
ncbi:hypothetical protein [Pseudooceanicola sp.]|uniref:hypothetical protein n=1 Tax=Pseudooceanicola sp. TaxID=1914328 RepID=UPI00261924B7|nr:hypothetical protein [Pseudooceanicola sp.]MDF1857186.1 hypothetical protein [Pseudooceanicola sp.]